MRNQAVNRLVANLNPWNTNVFWGFFVVECRAQGRTAAEPLFLDSHDGQKAGGVFH